MTEEVKKLVDKAVEAIQDKKGRGITVIDLSGIDGCITKAFIICDGGSPSQVEAIADNVEEKLRIDLTEKPVKTAGLENCVWVAMDYVDIMVHIFVPETREHYDLEHLWSDAPSEIIPDLD
ncbi:MAG: ribosome silencing factor [Bacteroidales bacterium]|nr:ribosome silencing factor [Bacteroidales bacterium]MCM1147903.1 ribosome silencing factor [Bacteroidales bacterium]MCM1205452.1 ribosome silencing factor [Bacillota bacterium]MCM1509286.1 ribosome silencing factor [Clostridium sp.]